MSSGKSFDSNSKAYLDLSELIPKYGMHVSRNAITLGNDMLLGVVAFQGTPFKTVLNGELEHDADHITRFFNELVKVNAPNIEFKTHMVKRKAKVHLDMQFDNWFSERLAKKYLEPFESGEFFAVRYYLSIIFKYKNIEKGVEEFSDLLTFVKQALAEYGVDVLGVYEDKENGALISQIGQFLASLVNCTEMEDNFITVNSGFISNKLQLAKIYFGSDLAEIRNHDKSKFGVFYDMMEYPPTSSRGMWNNLLDAKAEFTLTQSFFPFTISASSNAIESQLNKLQSSSRPPEGLIAELESVKSDITQGDVIIGEYHSALAVFADNAVDAVERGTTVTNLLRTSSYAMYLKATNIGHESFYSHLPGSRLKPFAEPKTTRNLACGWSLNNYPLGKAKGNPIGDGNAIIPLKTPADSLYYFNSHYSEIGKDNTGEKMLGHCMILGQSGAGKTTLEGVLANFIGRFNGKFFGIDFNSSMKLFFQTLGGKYFDIKEGEPTGLNPFQLPDGPGVRAFLYSLLAACGRNNKGEPVTAVEESKIKNAVDSIMMMPESQRRFSQVRSVLPPEGDDGIGDRLSKWQYSCDGTYAWALDCPVNLFNPNELDRIAFNCTDILTEGGTVVTEPILATLFEMKDMMQHDGGMMTTFVEEFWVPANFPTTQEKIKGTLKAGRIKNEFMFLVSQSPADAIQCEIFAAIVEQTATKIYLPNKKATWEEYQKCGLNRKEFDELCKLGLLSRTFLVSQDSGSGFCKLDLYGFNEFLPVISATWQGIALADAVREELGTEEISEWIPEFIKRYEAQQKK